MGSSITRRLGRFERLLGSILREPVELPNRVTIRMRQLARPALEPAIRFRFGYLQRLPEEYRGQRHVVIAKVLPKQNGQEWVEFQEVPGPAPAAEPNIRSGWLSSIDIVFVAPYPAVGPDSTLTPHQIQD